MSVYIVAEMACSHEGDPALARKIIDAAREARADAVQLQIWKLAAMVAPGHRDTALLSRLELSEARWEELFAYARPALDVVACVYEEESVAFAERLGVAAWKIHCADVANPRLLRRVAATGRPIHLSVGASLLGEVETAVRVLRAAGAGEIRLLHGYQSFPTPPDDVSLSTMAAVGRLLGLPYGYQDHSAPESVASSTLSAAAIGLGAGILEKHVTHDRSKRGVDHEAALNPDELVAYVRMVREVETALGRGLPRTFSPAVERYRRHCRKTAVAARALPAGHRLVDEDLLFLRTETPGLSPVEAERLVGRALRRPLAAFEALRDDDTSCDAEARNAR